MKKLRERFTQVSSTSLHYALRFRNRSVQSSLIRCYAMNFLEKAVFVRDS